MQSHSNISSSKEIEIVVNQLNHWMVDGLWKVDDSQSGCIQFPVANRHEFEDVVDQIKEVFTNLVDFSIRYCRKTKTAKIRKSKVKELYDLIVRQSIFLPKEEDYGYAGDCRIHGLIEETMNASGLNYNVSTNGLCAAFATAVKKAFLAGNIHLIKERLEFFNQLPVCDLIRVDNPNFDINKDIKDLAITTHFALVRFKGKLFLVNKPENRFHIIPRTKKKILSFDKRLNPETKARRLSEQDLESLERRRIHLQPIYLSELILSGTIPTEQKADLLAFFDMMKLVQDGNVEYLFNDCDLVLTETPPSLDTIDHLPIQAKSAYVRCGNQLYFINKTNRVCKLITSDKVILFKFDLLCHPSAKPRKLIEDELDHIPILTGYFPSFENDEAISQLIDPIALSQTKIYQDKTFTGVYDFPSLCTYLRSLHHAIATSQPLISMPFAISLGSINHSMVLGYDPKKEVWIFGNSNNNKIYTFGNSEYDFLKLSASIIKGFFQDENGRVKNGLAIMRSKIEGHESDRNALETMVQTWKKSDSFKALHQVIPDKAKLHDRYNASWLEIAVKADDVPTALDLIDRGAEINFQDNYYENTPLHYAAYRSNTVLVRALLDKQAKLNVLNKTGRTPLMIAVRNNNVELVKMFLAANPKLDIQDKDGNSVLHLAVAANNPTIVSMLLEAGANPKIENYKRCSPLGMAIKEGYHGVANKISTKISDLDHFLEFVLSGNVRMAEKYLTLGYLCVTDLKRIAFSYMTDDTLLHLVVRSNHPEMVQFLLDNQCDPNVHDSSGMAPLNYAVINQNIEIIKILIKRIKMDVDYASQHPFSLLAFLNANHQAEIINILKSSTSFDVNAQFKFGDTVLHYAAKKAPSLIASLLKWGANPNVRNDCGNTPLLSAVSRGSVDAVKALLENPETDRNCKNSNGFTPLMTAITMDKEEFAIELLNDPQVDPNIQCNYGGTALHEAVCCGQVEVVSALLSKGADPWIRDDLGRIPRDLASYQLQSKVLIALLLEAMKKPKVAFMPMTLFVGAAENRDVKVGSTALIKPVQTF